MFPPLFQSDYINKKPQILLQSMTKGINGPIKVNGKSYNGFMPATAINDADVAAVATYIMTPLIMAAVRLLKQMSKNLTGKNKTSLP